MTTLDLSRLAALVADVERANGWHDGRSDLAKAVLGEAVYAEWPALLQELRTAREAVEAARDAALEAAERECVRLEAEAEDAARSGSMVTDEHGEEWVSIGGVVLVGGAEGTRRCAAAIRALRARAAEAKT